MRNKIKKYQNILSYIEAIEKMNDNDFREECNVIIDCSIKYDNMPENDCHWKMKVCYKEAEKRIKNTIKTM